MQLGVPAKPAFHAKVVPGTNRKGRKRFRLGSSPRSPSFQSLFLFGLKHQTAQVAAEVLVPPGRPETGAREDRLNIRPLPQADFYQNVSLSRQMRRRRTGNHAIGIKTIKSAIKCQDGVEATHIQAQSQYFGRWNIGWV